MTLPNGRDDVNTAQGIYLVSADNNGDTSIADLRTQNETSVRNRYKAKYVTNASSSVLRRSDSPLKRALDGLPGGGGGPLQNMHGFSQTIVNNIVNALFGWTGAWALDDSAQALSDQAATVAALSAAVTALQNQQAAQGNSGHSVVVDFSSRADATSLGSDFTQTYSGPGTGVLGITSGKAAWQPVIGDQRTCVAVYNAEQSLTDFQMVGAAFASAPMFGVGGGTRAHSYLFGRSNAAGTSCVYADFTKNSAELGCVVSGVKTVFDTETISFKANSIYWLACGTVGGTRVFQVIEGSTPIITYTEVGTTSQLGASFRYMGTGGSDYRDAFTTSVPGRETAWAFSDNTPPSFVGSGGYIFRASTSTVDVSNGANLLPTNFFDNQGEHTDDITSDVVNGRFQASITGWYAVKARLKIAVPGAFPTRLALLLYRGSGAGAPSAYRYGADNLRGVNAVGSSGPPRGIESVWPAVYLTAGDYVQLGYDADGSASGVLTGEAAGIETYFSITLANKSLA